MRAAVVDLETTHREPAEANPVEWAAVVLTPPWFGEGGSRELSSLVKPPIPIPAETSAVHHIVDADVENAQGWAIAGAPLRELLAEPDTIAVAHNAAFEKEVLERLTPPLERHPRWLCTYKAAVRVWPDAPGHSNEVLRYYLGLGTGRRGHQAPYSALHDARVTAQILDMLLKAGASWEDMLAWTEQPALLPTCPLGDWRGHKWAEVDEGFLWWILRRIHDREDVRFCAKAELDRRQREHQEIQRAREATRAAGVA